MTIVPVAAWKPDLPDLVDDGSSVVKNVLPRTAKSYGPMPSMAVYSSALTARCQGAVGVEDTAGNTFAFAGDATHLYKLAAGSPTWADVSKAANYSTPTDSVWSATFFTPNRVLMTNSVDAIQSYVLGSSALFADLSAGAPKANHIAVVRDFVMALNTNDAVDGLRPTRAWWCAIGDPTSWPTPGTSGATAVQSDFQDINLGDFGAGMGIVGGLGAADVVLFFERGLVKGTYVGPGSIFAFSVIEGGRGTPAPGSIAQLGALAIYLGPDDLYAIDGSSSIPLGAEAFAKTLYSDIDQGKLYRVYAAFDTINKIYFLAYASNSSLGNCDRIIAYNWSLRRASLITDLGEVETILRTLSFGLTLEQLDAFGTLETLPFSLDSRAWTGGANLLSVFNASHKLAYLNGPPLAATVDTSEAQIVPDKRAFVEYVRPLVDGGTPSIAVATRERQTDAKVYGSAVPMDAGGLCAQRASGRYLTARITMPAGDTSWSQIFGIDLPEDAVSPDGDR